ncbi:MAG: hypothetical protein IIW14_06005 [Kiritimatiellae bacterium]|nr:hypothetical protein [Kiritimatiellia bacterium]
MRSAATGVRSGQIDFAGMETVRHCGDCEKFGKAAVKWNYSICCHGEKS